MAATSMRSVTVGRKRPRIPSTYSNFLMYSAYPEPFLPRSAPDGGESGSGTYHVPVLLHEVVEYLSPSPGKLIVDATLGGGGHTLVLLKAGARVVAFDRDPDAHAHARNQQGLASAMEDGRLVLVRGDFRNIESELAGLGISSVDGILADLGVSSHQLNVPERGFSAPGTAADLVNTLEASELERIFRSYGEERFARRIAAEIVRTRGQTPFTTTKQLVDAIERTVPVRGGKHPATRVFQALRIAVNEELAALDALLDCAPRLLAPGGRFAVITFHSLEDRAVKRRFRDQSRESIDRPEWPEPRPNPEWFYRLLTGKPVEPGVQEAKQNPRARSAKLRVVERRSYVT
jgi:16S rRNA (cytosine1402-N4)-methyltransferase